jgi:NADPH:quinone reductase-like Zn-dependent oxidoreductase
MGYRKPRKFIPGMEFSGVIESVGSKVTSFKKGDAVFGSGGMRMSSNAEYKSQPYTYAMAIKPSGVSHEEAAAIPVGGLNALHFLRKANIQPGQKVLVNGAGGSIGTFGVQLAKYFGAEVTAVDSTEKLDMLRAIGADHVIDYTREDFSQNGEKYDVIFDVVYRSSFSHCIRSLKPEGCYLMANPSPVKMLRGLWISATSGKKVIFEFAGEKAEDLTYLAKLIEAGKIKTVIDRTYPLEKIAEAHDYVQNGHKKGNIIITVEHDNKI